MKSPTPRSILSFDIGLKRIGLAGCDPMGITVTALEPLFRSNINSEIAYFRNLCINRNVKGLIFGLPVDENGIATSQSNYTKIYGSKVARAIKLPLAWVNEHSTSWEAQQRFNLKQDRSGKLDSASAVIILEQWLKDGPNLQILDSPSTDS